jgi:hypothetical protein
LPSSFMVSSLRFEIVVNDRAEPKREVGEGVREE